MSEAGNRRDREQRRTVGLIVVSHGLSKLGDALMNPKTTLGWLGASLGVPVWMIGLAVPIREAGSMVLQSLIAAQLDRWSRRKWVWSAGALLQGAAVAAMALSALTLQGETAGYALLGLLLLFALARSACSLASKDVMGRVLDASIRGRAGGWAAAAAGLATLLVASVLLGTGDLGQAEVIAWVLLAAAAAWWLAAALFAAVDEPRDDSAGSTSGSAWAKLRLLTGDRRLMRFVVIRSLLLCSALSAPYYLLLANQQASIDAARWWWFVLLAGLAGMLGGPIWGRLADRSSRWVMGMAAGLAAALGLTAFALASVGSSWLSQAWLIPGLFWLLCVAHEGVRIGRKTWIINIAEGQQRRDYVAASNTAMGLILLPVGALSAMLAERSLAAALLALALLGAVGAIMAWRLPAAESSSSG
ncbi:MFS transporter [Pseudomarimonas arenosa]|uniref:MFS transporter n=1 Tax=Pseudomarimonas arenosa TaxID=2774145 RepID=A0AAW3ZNS1_9GAMM|nr:MFS transporter [Pseudomarimonas arenosa]MBD8527179.1 MFS transporter [Pseudomarimonas arenosa]